MNTFGGQKTILQITYTRTGDDGNTNTQEVTASGLQNYQTEITSLSSGYSYEIKVTAFSSTAESTAQYITVTTGTCISMYFNKNVVQNTILDLSTKFEPR